MHFSVPNCFWHFWCWIVLCCWTGFVCRTSKSTPIQDSLKNTGNWGDQLHLRSPKEEFHSWDANASAPSSNDMCPDWAAVRETLKNLERQQLTLMEMVQVNNRLFSSFLIWVLLSNYYVACDHLIFCIWKTVLGKYMQALGSPFKRVYIDWQRWVVVNSLRRSVDWFDACVSSNKFMYVGLVNLEQFCSYASVVVLAHMYVSLCTGLWSGSLKFCLCAWSCYFSPDCSSATLHTLLTEPGKDMLL